MRRIVLLLASMATGVLLTSGLAFAYPEFALARVNPKDLKGSLEVDPSTFGVIVALLSVGVTTVGVVMTRLNAIETARRQEVGVDQWMRDLRNWASEAIEVFSKARYASEYTQEQDASSYDLRSYVAQLSALVDRGRFFLPNQGTTELDKEKLSAFRGTRHRALVPLIAALNVLDDNVEKEHYKYVFDNRPKVLRELQKEFVSHIQQILTPKERNREIARLIKISDEQLQALDGYQGTGANQRLRDVVKRLRYRTNERGEEMPPGQSSSAG